MTKLLRVSGLLAVAGALALALIALSSAQADPPAKAVDPRSEILISRALDIATELEDLHCDVKICEANLAAELSTSQDLRSKVVKLEMLKNLVNQGLSTAYSDFLVDESLARAMKQRIPAVPGQTEKEKLANFASSKELDELQEILVRTLDHSRLDLAELKNKIADLRRKKVRLERELKLLPFEAVSPAEAQAKE